MPTPLFSPPSEIINSLVTWGHLFYGGGLFNLAVYFLPFLFSGGGPEEEEEEE